MRTAWKIAFHRKVVYSGNWCRAHPVDSESAAREIAGVRAVSFTRLGLMEESTAQEIASWPIERSGFKVHVETVIADRERLQTKVRYLVRPPVALERLHYVEKTGEVRYRTRKGADLQYLTPVDVLAD